MSLKDRLISRIAALGPMTVAEFMTAALHDPQDGYYATRPALGEAGDFITAPMTSQVFGELVGLWVIEVFQALGAPQRLRLIELGPGDGSLMSDILRVARLSPGFVAALEIWLVETSPVLHRVQAQRLQGREVHVAGSLEDTPSDAPFIVIGNEFLDCLPVRQFVRTSTGWCERVLAIQGDDLVYGLAGAVSAMIPEDFRDAPLGALVEVSPSQRALGASLGARVKAAPGAALFIDYGSLEPTCGSTLQALYRHQRQDPLDAPGRADLTVHADFAGVADAARRSGGGAVGVHATTQANFLRALGADVRFDQLSQANPRLVEALDRQRSRLLDEQEMGSLFKALAITPRDLVPPGFGPPPALPLVADEILAYEA